MYGTCIEYICSDATCLNCCDCFSEQLLENMTEVVRKGILEAEVELQKANEEKLIEEVCVCMILVMFTGEYKNPVLSNVRLFLCLCLL